MTDQHVYGLTGGICSGKSLALHSFKKLGFLTIDCDQLAREVVRPGQPAYKKIIRLFGREVLLSNRTLNRKKLAGIIFQNAVKRKKLEKFIHPEVLKKMNQHIQNSRARFIIVDVPLLFEAGWQKYFDLSILVWCSPSAQLNRLMKRDHLSGQEARFRLRSQMPMDKKRKCADFVLKNQGTTSQLKKQIQFWVKNNS